MQEYRVVLFSSCKENDQTDDINYISKAEEWLEDVCPKIKNETKHAHDNLNQLIEKLNKIEKNSNELLKDIQNDKAIKKSELHKLKINMAI